MRERILIIEDEDRILQFLRRGLTYEGYRVETAADGTSGLALARETAPAPALPDRIAPARGGGGRPLLQCPAPRHGHASGLPGRPPRRADSQRVRAARAVHAKPT